MSYMNDESLAIAADKEEPSSLKEDAMGFIDRAKGIMTGPAISQMSGNMRVAALVSAQGTVGKLVLSRMVGLLKKYAPGPVLPALNACPESLLKFAVATMASSGIIAAKAKAPAEYHKYLDIAVTAAMYASFEILKDAVINTDIMSSFFDGEMKKELDALIELERSTNV